MLYVLSYKIEKIINWCVHKSLYICDSRTTFQMQTLSIKINFDQDINFINLQNSKQVLDPDHKMKELVNVVNIAYEKYVESVVPRRKRRSRQ